MEALTVTPSSGAQPYLFEATFNERHLIDSSRYILRFRFSSGVGTCPAKGVGTGVDGAVDSFLATDSFLYTTTISEGNCRIFTLSVIDTLTESEVSFKSATINNI